MRLRFLYRAFKARYHDQRHEIRAVLSRLPPGTVAVDVGANKGAYLYWLRCTVGGAGKVFAYEPQPRLAQYLQSVCAVMKWRNVIVRDCALSDWTGISTLYVPGRSESPGASLERAVVETTLSHSYKCVVDTLDHQLLGIDRVDFLKVDVEGHELQVFRGASQILSRDAPAILFECETRFLRRHTIQDVFGYLQDFCYDGAFVSPKGLRPLAEFDPAIHQRNDSERFWDAPGYCSNFLFTAQARRADYSECRPS